MVTGDRRETILFLADELTGSGLPQRIRDLIRCLSLDFTVVLVAQCYLRPSHRKRRLGIHHELYGFAAEGYNKEVAAFAAGVIERHRPDWVLLYGWENAQLVVEIDRLDRPVISFIEYASAAPNAESQINRSFRHTTDILFSDASIPASFTSALWGLGSRDYKILGDGRATVAENGTSSASWLSQLRGRRNLSAPPLDPDFVANALAHAGRHAAQRRARSVRQGRLDGALIDSAGGLDVDLAVPRGGDVGQATSLYLRASELTVPRDRVFAGRLLRRPIAGFNPLIYASDNPNFNEKTGEDPLAHYLRTGRPTGRWSHTVIRPDESIGAPCDCRAAVHAHLHYPELLPELLQRLAANRTQTDLFVTTTSEERAAAIAAHLDHAGVAACSLVVWENRGRDLWPFISLMQAGTFQDYSVVGHFHGKRSPHFDLGHVWRDFLWTHLVGGPQRMLDIILTKFVAAPNLGLVFAEDPHLEGWEKNLHQASEIAAKVGIRLPLPTHFEYPMGTMFWARPAALAPLLQVGWTADDIPPEPLAIDGTILHAIERLIPFFVGRAGFEYATTHVPGSVR